MLSVQHVQPLLGGLPQPQAKRHRRVGEKVVHAPNHFHLRVLHDIGRVHTGAQARVEVGLDEVAQLRPIALQQGCQGPRLPPADVVEQRAGGG